MEGRAKNPEMRGKKKGRCIGNLVVGECLLYAVQRVGQSWVVGTRRGIRFKKHSFNDDRLNLSAHFLQSVKFKNKG